MKDLVGDFNVLPRLLMKNHIRNARHFLLEGDATMLASDCDVSFFYNSYQ